MNRNPSPLPISDLAEVRLERLLGEQAALRERLAVVADELRGVCQTYSDAHGYRVRLDPVQVRRAMAAERGR